MQRRRSDETAQSAAPVTQGVVEPVGDAGSGSVLTIDLAAIQANYRDLRARAAPAACAAVVKADAYGLGVARVAPALEAAGCELFFVATLDEGLALRPLLRAPSNIAVLNGLEPGSEETCRRANLVPVVNDPAQYRACAALAGRLGRRLPIMLQFDTGMARFGLCERDAIALAAEARAAEALDITLLLSHLACASQPDHPANAAQLAAMERMSDWFPGHPRSLAASSGIVLGEAYHMDVVRPGAALYGIFPGAGVSMRPVVRLQGRVMQVRDVPPGTSAGYGHEWTAARPTRLATIAAGYADGLFRGASLAAWHGGRRMAAVGCLSMDSVILDATGVDLRLGDLVDLIGPDHDVDAMAALAGTIGYDVLTRLGHRFHRRYIGGSV